MFWPDVIDLKLFYASRLGKMAQSSISRSLRRIWPPSACECVLGIGYTQPYIHAYCEQAKRVLALMPAAQGALHWPLGGKNLTFLAEESEIPLPDESVSHVLIAHAFENTEQLRAMLREIWRVLSPGGRLLVIVPNRSGVWARVPSSPFAHGSPYSASQLRAVLRDNRFTPYDSHHALFTPPSTNEFLLAGARFFDYVGKHFFTMFSGIILMEAEKQIYAPSTQRVVKTQREKHYVPVQQPVMTFKGNN